MAKINYRNKVVSKDEVGEALSKCGELLEKKINQQSELNIVDYLEGHKKNTEFKRRNGFKNSDILELALEVVNDEDTLYYFCHKERDSKDPKNPMYCFKLNFEHIDGEVLFKFKFRYKEDGEQVFIMSFHYPDSSKEDWVHLWIKDN